ncbi:SDR family oxidoreductase [Pararhizobium qamdonense]|uniref:SDR family oxidoreductase n=1 Tax=Pararhizobium qamdonense TaxID=3031126 RepID=UPI0023E350DE|nr:SDR family oxidoreductase [Pararhizobium qamdonense]
MTTENSSKKTALVFGGARGIGAAAVERLAKDGFAVAFTYVSRPDKASELVKAVEAAGGKAFAIQADSSDAAAIKGAVATAVEKFGKLDTAVVNAGVFKMAAVDEVSVEDLDLMLNINVRAVFLSVQAAVAQMKDGGHVITIGSNVAVRTAGPGASVYQFTKAAVAAMVKGLAKDLAPRKITVNNVQPGPTNTDINAGAIEMLADMSPLKRVAAPEEIAGLISYLAGEESSYMTGSSLTIDGGFIL